MKRHIALVNLPLSGHLNPTMAVVRELVDRGHRVSYPSTPDRAAQIGDTGAAFLPYRSTLASTADAPVRMPDRDHWLTEMRNSMLDEAELTMPPLLAAFTADRPDLVLHDRAAFAGKLLATTLGLPTFQLLPSLATNEHWNLLHRFAPVDQSTESFQRYARKRDALVEGYGVPWNPKTFDNSLARGHVVFLPREFQSRGETFGPDYHFVGPCLGPRPSAQTWAGPRAGRPVLLISMGSLNNAHPEFYRTCLTAFGDSPWHVVLAVGERFDPAVLGPVPENIEIMPYVPQLEVLAQAQAMLCHAGMGSTMEALHHGVPLVLVPLTPEQEANAERVAELGLGLRLDPDRISAPVLRQAVRQVSTDRHTTDRIRQMQHWTRAAGGAVRAADAIEAALGGPAAHTAAPGRESW